MSMQLQDLFWAPHYGLFRQLVDDGREPDGQAVVAALHSLPRAEFWDVSVVRSLWSIPSTYLHRQYHGGGNAWGEIFNATEELLDDPRCMTLDPLLKQLDEFWDSRRDGFLGMLRRPELGYSEPALQRFLGFLDVLPSLHGQVSKKWITGLGDSPTRCWSSWRRGSFEDRMQLQRQLLPRLARILGEPYPGHVAELLSFSQLTEAQMPT